MTTSARGRHRKLRRNILHTVIATALLAGTFTAVDQSLNVTPAIAAPGEPGSLDLAISSDSTNTVAVQSNGGIIAGLASSPFVRRYSASGVRDTSFTSTTTGEIGSVAVQPDDKVLALSGFAIFKGGLVRDLAAGGADSGWTKDSANSFNENGKRVIAQLSNGSIAVGGYYAPDRLHLLGTNGVRNSTFSTNVALNQLPNMPSSVLVQNDGGIEKILVAGYDSTNSGFFRRYNTDGTLDTTFTSGTGFAPTAMTIIGSGSDARIVAYIGNASAAGYAVQKIAVFQPNGVRDTTSPLATALGALTFNATGSALAVDSFGNLLVGGSFTGKLRRYSSTGVTDTLFNSNSATAVTGDVRSISIQPDGKILLATSAGVIRLNSDYANPGPRFTSAAVSVDGLSVTLDFSTELGSVPSAASAFAVTRNGVPVPVTGVSVSGTQATLTLSSTIGVGQTVTIAYTAPARDDATSNLAIQTTAGGDALNFTVANSQVTNNSTADRTGPTYTPASAVLSADGVTLTLTYSEALSATTAPTSAFTVTAGTVRTVSSVVVSGSQVVLTLAGASAIGSGVTTTVGYTAPTANDATSNAAIQDTVGNDAATINNQAVTNNSTVDRTSPTYTASSAIVATDGMSMTLTYNEALSSVTALASAFAVVSGGTARTITSVATDGAKVILYFASPLSQVATTTVSYTAPAIVIGTSNSAIQDIAGNDAISLPLQSAVNNSTVDATGPSYTAGTAVLDSTGMRITMTYSEALNARTADPSAFTVTSGVSTRSVTDVTVSGSTVTLTLASPIAAGASATVSYAASTSSSLTSNLAVQDVAGNDGVSLNSIAITNNSTINFALAPNLTGVTAPTTTKIVLSFDKTLNATTASTTDFTVTSGGNAIAVTAATVVGSTVELTLASAMSTSYQTFVTYTAPTSDATTANSAIQSSVGNDAASFVRQPVDLLATGTQITEVVSSPTAIPGQKIDLIARMPFTQTGSTSQEIVQQIDPSVIQLTGINDIAYPNGWALSYCSGLTTDCTVAGNFSTTAPTTAAGWALVKAVKATGNVISDGTNGGNLIATANANYSTPPQAAFNIATGGSGDGWNVRFDNRGNVFNMFHHGPQGLDCHLRSGARCGPNWPFAVPFETLNQADFHVNTSTNKVFYPTSKFYRYGQNVTSNDLGIACIDISNMSAVTMCNSGSGTNGYTSMAITTSSYEGPNGWAVVGSRLYTLNPETGNVLCFDMRLNGGNGGICVGEVSFDVPQVTIAAGSVSEIKEIGGKVFGTAESYPSTYYAFCYDPATKTSCAGWETSKTLTRYSARVLEIPNSSGAVAAACFVYGNADNQGNITIPWGANCYTPAGTLFSTPAWVVDKYAPNQGHWNPRDYGYNPETSGTRIYWSNNAADTWGAPNKLWKYYCVDVVTGNFCANFPIQENPVGTHSSYSLTLDPQNTNCLWVNNDANRIRAFDAITGQPGCTSPSSTVSFSGATAVPRLSCTDENGVRAWRNVTLKSPANSGYTAVRLTVLDSSGEIIPGYTDITTTLTNGSGQRYWDLSALPVSITGQNPRFQIEFTGLTATTAAEISISAEGGSPQLCLTPVTVVKCPTGVGVLDPSTLLATTSTVTGSGSSTVGGTTTPLTSSTSNLSVSAPSLADCSSSLRGRAGYSGNGGTGDPVAGATVRLLNSSGQPVLDAQGNPITTVTGADGRYAFDNLYPGSYQVAFQAPADKTLVSATTVSGASGSTFATTATNTSSVTATTSAVAVGTYAVVNSLYMVAMTANPDTTSGLKGQTQTINLITNPNASGTDVPSQGSTVVANSVKLCDTTETSPNCTKTSVTVSGVGTYSVDATGQMTFTPLANYTGTPTPLAYTVMDTAGGTGASTYTPTVIGPPAATADTTSGPLNVAQSINVLTNTVGTSDSAGSGATLVASSLTLSCPATPTTPTCSVSNGAVTIAGQGNYTKASDGTVTFTPVNNYSGTPTPVKYTVTDSSGQTATSTYTPTIIPPPTVRADTTSAGWDVTQSINVVTSATVAGTFGASLNTGDSAGNGTTLAAGSIRLCAPNDVAPDCTIDGSGSVVIANQGTYTVDTATNTITFNPLDTYTGQATSITYSITDALGQKSSTTYTPTVTAPPVPTASPDTIALIAGGSLPFSSIFDGQTGDSDPALATKGTGGPDLTNASVCLIDPATSLCDTNGIVEISGQGTYTLDATTGIVTYAADANATEGAKTPVTYKITDGLGRSATSTLTPTIYPKPTADDDISSGAYDTNQIITPFSNDDNVPGQQLGSLKLCGLDDPTTSGTNEAQSPNNCDKTSVTTPDGVYRVVGNTVEFDPDSDFSGLATVPVRYQAKDGMNQFVNALITPTVLDPADPTTDPETTSGKKGATQTIDLLAGDTTAAQAITLNSGSVVLSCTVGVANCSVTANKVTITGVGTYEIDPAKPGFMLFTPDPNFTGLGPSVTYTVTDSMGGTGSNTYTPTVIPPPTLVADTTTAGWDVTQSINVVTSATVAGTFGASLNTGDSAGNGTTLAAGSIRLCAPNDVAPDCTIDGSGSVVIANQGTYTVDTATNTITFNPLDTYTGQATSITYSITDALGQKSSTTYTPTVTAPPVPTASPEEKSVLPGQSVIFKTITGTNGLASGTGLQTTGANKTCLFTPNTTTCDATNSITVSGEGTYTLNPATGIVTFVADANATSAPKTPITYQVTDVTGQKATSTLTPIIPPPPVADDETDTVPFNTAKQIDVLNGDSPGNPSAPLVPSTLKLCDPSTTPPQTGATCAADEVTIANKGTYKIVNGKVEFTPVDGYSGSVTPIDYIVKDSLGQIAQGTITLSIPLPPAPIAKPDVTSGPWNQPQSINVIDNATGNTGDDIAGTGASFVPTSVVLSCGSAADCSTATVNGKIEVTIANQGTYKLGTNGEVIFTPVSTFKDAATPVTYTVTDNSGQSATSIYTPTVAAPPAPTADPETTLGNKGATQTIDLIPGDTTFDPAITLVRASVVLTCKSGVANCSVTANKVTITGVGTYEIDPANPGHMLFTPEPNFTGVAPAVNYEVTDSMGGKASSTYTPTVIAPPVVRPDTTSAGWDVTQSINVVTDVAANGTTNDAVASSDSVDPLTTLKANSLTLSCPTSPLTPTCTVNSGVSVEITGQGTYTADPATNEITFNPLSTFVGQAKPVVYTISDDRNQTASTTYTPTVVVPVPVATPEVKNASLVLVNPSDTSNNNVNFGDMQWKTTFKSVLTGSDALATGTGLKSGSTDGPCLINPTTNVCSASVTIPGEGTYTMNQTTGVVTFVSEVVAYSPTGSNITPGPKTAVSYRVTDALGRTATSTLTPVIPPPPVANPDFSTGVQGVIQNLSPVGNDRPGGGLSTELYPDERTQKPSGIYLCAANQPPPDCRASEVIIPNVGTLTVDDNGAVTFTPVANFVGTTPAIGYQIPDNLGQKAYSTITITVVPPPAPSAIVDTGSAEYNKPVTLKPWLNDAAGAVPAGSSAPAPSLVATSIKLCDDNSTFVAMSGTPADCTATKVTTVEGTYEVNATTGEVVFTPNPNMIDPITGLATGMSFVGTVKYPPTYQIWNNWTGLGGAKSATALLVPTIAPPGAPAATVDITKTKPGTSVVLNPVSNDKPGTAALDPTTIRLCGTGEISPSCTQMSVTTLDGLYVVNETTGEVTFTPRDGFTGKATIPYIIKDGLGMMALSNLIITVEDTAVVPVAKKTKVGLAKTGGTRPDLLLLLGLVAIAAAGGLRVLGRKK